MIVVPTPAPDRARPCSDGGQAPGRASRAPDAGLETRGPHLSRSVRAALAVALLLILALGYAGDAAHTRAGHIMELAQDLESVARGHPMVAGPELAATGLRLGGPFFLALHQPARLLSDPAVGLHALYALYQALALAMLALAARRARIGEGVVWAATLLLAASPAARSTVLENAVLAADACVAGLGLLLVADARRHPGWSFAAGAVLAAAACLHGAAVLPLAGAALGMIFLDPPRAPRFTALAGGAAFVLGAGMLVELWTEVPLVGSAAPAAGSGPGVVRALGTPGVVGLLLASLHGWGLVPLGGIVAVLTALRQPTQRPIWAATLAWLGAAIALAVLAAPEIAASMGANASHGRPMLKVALLAGPALALLAALGLGTLGALMARGLARLGLPAPSRGGALLALGLAAAVVPTARGLRAPEVAPGPPEPFMRSGGSLADLSRHLAPYLAADLAGHGVDPLRFSSFDATVRLLVLWRPPWRRAPSSSGDVVLFPADPALPLPRLAGAFEAGAMLAIPACQPLPLASCGADPGARGWCGEWPGAWERDGLVLLLRAGRGESLLPAGMGTLADARRIVDRSWSQEGARGDDFEWLALEVTRGAGPGPVRIVPSPTPPPGRDPIRPPPIRYLYSSAGSATLDAWFVPLSSAGGGPAPG